MENIINNLTVLVNEKKYDGEKLYVTLGIKFGFAISKVVLLPDNKMINVNSSCGNLFANYIKLMMRKKFRIYIRTKVNANMMYLSFQTKNEKADDILEKVLKSIYESEIDEDLFIKAKDITIENYIESYQNPEFRAYYKLLEFVHMQKNFDSIKLNKDIENINLKDFTMFMNNIVCLENSVLFINGNIEFLLKSRLNDVVKNIKTHNSRIVQASNTIDEYLTTDRCVVSENGHDVRMGSIKFMFFNPNISMLDKEAILTIISTILFKRKSQVIVDEFDSAIIYFDTDLKPYKEKINQLITKENINKARESILNVFAKLYEYNPYAFNERYIEYFSKGINITEYLKVIENCDEETINKVYVLGDIKITEAQVLYRME